MSDNAFFRLIDTACGWNFEKFQQLDKAEFNRFAEEYVTLCELRETDLYSYLREQNYYRTFIPISAFTFGTLPQLVGIMMRF